MVAIVAHCSSHPTFFLAEPQKRFYHGMQLAWPILAIRDFFRFILLTLVPTLPSQQSGYIEFPACAFSHWCGVHDKNFALVVSVTFSWWSIRFSSDAAFARCGNVLPLKEFTFVFFDGFRHSSFRKVMNTGPGNSPSHLFSYNFTSSIDWFCRMPPQFASP